MGEAHPHRFRLMALSYPAHRPVFNAAWELDLGSVLRAMRDKWGKQAWGRYGFVDAFHPAANWYDADVLGIDQGISVLMAENLRTSMIWDTFMRNPEMTAGR